MSESQAKKKRKKAPKVIGQLQATFYEDGGITLQGVPMDLDLATKWGFEIQRSIFKQFVNMAMDGKLKKKSAIIQNAVAPSMKQTTQELFTAADKKIKAGLN